MTERKVVVFTTYWRLSNIQGRVYGMCFVDAPSDMSNLSLKRGFKMTNPTHARCALYAFVMGMEHVLNIPMLAKQNYLSVVVTKSTAVRDIFANPAGLAKATAWVADARMRPSTMCGHNRLFMRSALELYNALRRDDIGDIMYMPSDETEEQNLLSKRKVHLDIDPEKDYSKKIDEMDIATNVRHRNFLTKDLMQSNARGSRRTIKMTNKQKKKVAQTEGCAQQKKKETVDNKTVEKNDDDGKFDHSGLIAAIAAEERRCAAENARVAGDIQESQHGVGGRDEPAEN